MQNSCTEPTRCLNRDFACSILRFGVFIARDGWHQLIAWLGEHKIGRVHACLEATGRYGLGIALALHEAGYVVSIVNPAQIRNFARTKLGRNKTDQVDAVRIREYAELFKPRPWTPPSPAMRRLCELQTLRAGTSPA